ncbi:MAG: Hsp20/alpha crystallin family protein [Phycisphaerae bacterium]|nr:Hsp20/alpha crystallin family protein [Phycisphaerae bacterium]
MLLSEWSPGSAFSELRREMDRLFDGYLGTNGGRARPAGFPALNVWEDGDNLYAEAEIPGVPMEDLEIYVVGNELTVKGQRKPADQEGIVCHRQERGMGSFSRSLTLPSDVDSEKVQAKLCNGVLTLTMPKAEAARPKRIEIKTT